MMRNKLALLAFFGVMLSSMCARAQSRITLPGDGTYNVTFQGMGAASTIAVSLGTCGATTCSLSGSGNGPWYNSGPYEFISGIGSITLTAINTATGLWQVNQTSNILFDYGAGGSLLTGNLHLVYFSQPPGVLGSQFIAYLSLTGGSLASFLERRNSTTVYLVLRHHTNLANLLGTTNSVQAKLSQAYIPIVPEPASMMLMGSALLAVGGFLRRGRLA